MLRQVGPQARRLLEWRYRESLSTAEIARRLGRTDPWVRTTLSRLRQELRVCLEMR
jgi:RNA polymerase sigma factor (sigma-70 family)